MFQIVSVHDNHAPLRDGNGVPFLFATGVEAAKVAAEHSAKTGLKFQPRRIVSQDWRKREEGRFASGEYVQVPWLSERWFAESKFAKEHYLHVSVNEPGKVAFTETAEKGMADVQTRMKAGKYLARFFSDELSDLEIRDIATSYAALYEDNKLQFATEADDIEWVYTHGPESCMGYTSDHFDSPFHPVRVYAAGDLAIAYITRQNRVTARCLCWPEKKVYTRPYGDEYRITDLLDSAGYNQREGHCFYGAKLTRRTVDDEYFVLPYIDWHRGVTDCGKHLEIARDGELTCESTSGLVSMHGEGTACDRCGTRCDEDYLYSVIVNRHNDTETWCDGCCECNAYSTESGDYCHSDIAVEMADGEYWTPYQFRNYGFESDYSGANYHVHDRVEVCIANGGVEYWSEDEAEANAESFECNWYVPALMVTLADGRRVTRNAYEARQTFQDIGLEGEAEESEDTEQQELELA